MNSSGVHAAGGRFSSGPACSRPTWGSSEVYGSVGADRDGYLESKRIARIRRSSNTINHFTRRITRRSTFGLFGPEHIAMSL